MRRNVFLISWITIGLAFICCDKKTKQYIYPEDAKLSKSNGDAIDSLGFFFPTGLMHDDNTVDTGLDTFHLQWYSSQIFPAKEPILFNYYLGRNIYRFSWLRSFHDPVFLTLYREGEEVWMTIKQLDRQPDFMPTRIFADMDISKGEAMDTVFMRKFNESPLQPPNRHANLRINQIKKLSMNEWIEFENLLNRAGYWEMPPNLNTLGLDGSQWIMEAHSKNRYWIVDRWSPDDSIKVAGVYLIKLSCLNEEIY